MYPVVLINIQKDKLGWLCNELDFEMHKYFPDILIVLRDTKERGRDIENILHQYTTLVKPAFEEFCLPVSFSSFPEYQNVTC